MEELNKVRKLREAVKKNSYSVDGKMLDRLKDLCPNENYEWNDKGFSQLFAHINLDFCCYNTTSKEWYTYNGKTWERDPGCMRVMDKAEDLYVALKEYSRIIQDESTRSNYQRKIADLGKFSKRETVLKDSRDQHFRSQKDFDCETDLFNCQNGTFNLRTLEFERHDFRNLLTKISNVHYDPDAASPLFEKFISEVMQGDQDKINYLQKALGYALTAETNYETCFILYGATTRNGKSTLVETIAHMMGGDNGYALGMNPKTLALKKNDDTKTASGDIARLDGCRFLNVSEPPKKMIFDSALLKTLLGRDTITARHLFEREFEFRPFFKLFINTNFLPVITDDTLFTSGRINVLAFERHFSEEEQDKTLKDRLILQENISGIFNWCVEGLRKFRAEGLKPPPSVAESTADYREDSDKIGKFINDCLIRTPGKNCTGNEAYNIFEQWCEHNGYFAENKGNFFSELKHKNIFAKNGRINGTTYHNIVKGYEVNNDVFSYSKRTPHNAGRSEYPTPTSRPPSY